MASLLYADGPLSLERSEYYTTIISSTCTADGFFFLSNENARQMFQADVMAFLLNADGPLSLGRSECLTTF